MANINTLTAVSFSQARMVNLQKVMLMYSPEFPPDQAAAVQGNNSTVFHSLDQKQWVALPGWLDSLTNAVVQCRRSGFMLKLNRRPGMTATLLPHNIKAWIWYRDKAGNPQEKELEVVLDAEEGVLKLQMPFTPAGNDVYDAISTAMKIMTPPPQAEVHIDYSHTLSVRIPAPPPPPPPPQTGVGTSFVIGHIADLSRVRMATMAAQPAAGAPMTTFKLEPQTLSAIAGAQFVMAKRSEPITMKANLATGLAGAQISTVDMKRVFVPPPTPPPQGDRIESRTINGRLSTPINHPESDANVYPDLPRASENGWGQVPGNPKLHFRDSEKIDTFFYVPTKFKLGYYFEGGGEGVQAPLRVEVLRDSTGDKIRVTMVALPCIEDAERAALRNFLHDQVLQRLQPFVSLEPRSGIHAEFSPDFTSGTAADPKNLPAEIVFRALEIASPHERIKLQFEMPASQYSIFMEMMKFGIFGRVTLRDQGLDLDVSVRLQLSDMITNYVQIDQAAPATGAPASTPNPPAPAGATLTIRNLLAYPVQVSSLAANLLDVGDTSGIVLDAESVDLLPSGGNLAASAQPGSTASFTVQPQRLVGWDTTVIQPGQLKVVAGSPEDWLNQVNRDPSLDSHEYQVPIQILASPAVLPQVQLVRARLYKDGDPNPRTKFDCRPEGAAPPLRVSMTLAELMGSKGAPPTFSLEYETLLASGALGPTQRIAVQPDAGSLILRALAPTANTIFTMEYDSATGPTREEVAAAALDGKIAQLRSEGRHWEIFTRERS